jgi:protein-tyrosine-phosphatase
MNIVFVCTSNTCRSPVSELFAVEYFRRKLNMSREQQEEKGIVIRSAAYVEELPWVLVCRRSMHPLRY